MDASMNQNLLKYLLANTQPGTYLVAVGGANEASSYILQTGRPVLTFGGFLGQYDEVSVAQLAALVKTGRLRFVAGGDLTRHQAIAQWVQTNCKLVDASIVSGATSVDVSLTQAPNGQAMNSNLYDCGK